MQADRLISQIREEADPTSATAKKAFEKLGKLGRAAVPKILEALASADKRQTVEYVEMLSSLISDKTLPLITRGLAEDEPRIVVGDRLGPVEQANATTSTGSSTCSARTSTRRPALIEVLPAHKDRLNVRQLLGQIYHLQAEREGGGLQAHRRGHDRRDGPGPA